MLICESFASIQGEGRYVGIPSYFIRTLGCNLKCCWRNKDGSLSHCDTPYSSIKPEKGVPLNYEQLLSELGNTRLEHVVITGGEPTLQSDLSKIVGGLCDSGYKVTIETNGTRFISGIPKAFISLSPKLKSANNNGQGSWEYDHHEKQNVFIPEIRKWIRCNDYQLKFVISKEEDFEEILKIQGELEIPGRNIWLMPQGISIEELKKMQAQIIEFCVSEGMNYSPRLHIDIFGNKRGV